MKTDKEWESRARELLSRDFDWCPPKNVHDDIVKAALKLGREMADARAEEIAREIEADSSWCPHPWCESAATCLACLTRKTIVERTRKAIKPKTREQVLEEALCEIERMTLPGEAKHTVARRALEWTPEDIR